MLSDFYVLSFASPPTSLYHFSTGAFNYVYVGRTGLRAPACLPFRRHAKPSSKAVAFTLCAPDVRGGNVDSSANGFEGQERSAKRDVPVHEEDSLEANVDTLLSKELGGSGDSSLSDRKALEERVFDEITQKGSEKLQAIAETTRNNLDLAKAKSEADGEEFILRELDSTLEELEQTRSKALLDIADQREAIHREHDRILELLQSLEATRRGASAMSWKENLRKFSNSLPIHRRFDSTLYPPMRCAPAATL